MPRVNPVFRLGVLLGAAGWLVGCSDSGPPKAPAQPPQVSLQNAPTTAKVALFLELPASGPELLGQQDKPGAGGVA
jgi:hypothetical protein